MTPSLTITIADPDVDYLGIEIRACNERFAGSTWVYASLDELTELAARIEGFPKSPQDERQFEFGSRDSGVAGGFCSFHFHCLDSAGHAAVEIEIEDNPCRYSGASAKFGFGVEAGDVDRFIENLRHLRHRIGVEAVLKSSCVAE